MCTRTCPHSRLVPVPVLNTVPYVCTYVRTCRLVLYTISGPDKVLRSCYNIRQIMATVPFRGLALEQPGG
jgi:hypothetical protein